MDDLNIPIDSLISICLGVLFLLLFLDFDDYVD